MNKVGEGYLPSSAGNISASFSMIKMQYAVQVVIKSFNNTGPESPSLE